MAPRLFPDCFFPDRQFPDSVFLTYNLQITAILQTINLQHLDAPSRPLHGLSCNLLGDWSTTLQKMLNFPPQPFLETFA